MIRQSNDDAPFHAIAVRDRFVRMGVDTCGKLTVISVLLAVLAPVYVRTPEGWWRPAALLAIGSGFVLLRWYLVRLRRPGA